MLRAAAVVAALVLLGGCTTSTPDQPSPKTPTASASSDITFDSLGLDDWTDGGSTAWASRPTAPRGFSDDLVQRMAAVIEPWAERSTLSEKVRRDDSPVEATLRGLPASVATGLAELTSPTVTPRLSLVNVFDDDVEVLGTRYTSAWRTQVKSADDGREFLSLSLQTRTAYEVRRDDGPVQVIGMLRVHTLTAFPETTDEFGTGYAWQEFGAADCALALADALTPDVDPEGADELKRFVKIGNSPAFNQPSLDAGDRVDDNYEQQCESGAV